MSGTLLTNRRFAPLFWCQFFSAFNDTYLKAAVTFIVVFNLSPAYSRPLTLVATILMTAPAFLLSGLGGELADRYDKARVARQLKLAEFGAVAIACLGFLWPSLTLLFISLGLFGSLSALFGPIKYGILPDHLTKEQLPGGNALVETASFLAAIFGATVAALTSMQGHGDPRWTSALTLLFAALAYVAERCIPPTGEGAPNLDVDFNVFRSTQRLIGCLRADTRLWRGAIIISLFWLFAIVVYTLLTPVVAIELRGDELVYQVYNTLFAVGIALGSGFASWLVAGRTIVLPAVFAGAAIGFDALDLAWTLRGGMTHAPLMGVGAFFTTWRAFHVGIDLFLIAFFGGLFIVPTFAAVQSWAPASQRARIVGAVNVMNALFMVIGLLATIALQARGASFAQVFLALGIFSLVASSWILWALPTDPLRDLGALLLRLLHRMTVVGIENITKADPNAIIVLNRMSLLHAPIAFTVLDGNCVFAIDRAFAQRWWMRPIFKRMTALPLDGACPFATRRLIQLVKRGNTLVYFLQGRTGPGSPINEYDYPGLIADKSCAPIIAVHIEGTERSRFSYLADMQTKVRLFPCIKVTILEQRRLEVPEELTGRARRHAAGAALCAIMSETHS